MHACWSNIPEISQPEWREFLASVCAANNGILLLLLRCLQTRSKIAANLISRSGMNLEIILVKEKYNRSETGEEQAGGGRKEMGKSITRETGKEWPCGNPLCSINLSLCHFLLFWMAKWSRRLKYPSCTFHFFSLFPEVLGTQYIAPMQSKLRACCPHLSYICIPLHAEDFLSIWQHWLEESQVAAQNHSPPLKRLSLKTEYNSVDFYTAF